MAALRRLAAPTARALVGAWVVLTVVFLALEALPGQPTRAGLDPAHGRSAQRTQRRLLGLDRPLPERYALWLSGVARGDWGRSWSDGRPVLPLVASRLGPSLELATAALLVQYLAALPLAVASVRRPGRAVDLTIRIGATLLYAAPAFWLGLLALRGFALHLGWFPYAGLASVVPPPRPAGRLLDLARHLALPALVLGLSSAAGLLRIARNQLLEISREPFVLAGRARGLSEARHHGRHVLRRAAVPLVQLLGASLPWLFSATLVTEVVFSRPGAGRLAYRAFLARDQPVLLACTAVTAVLALLGRWLADLLHAGLDPRVRGV
ncbi:MAG: ABC transporter permease [Thermoanaerobaculia bacterium]